jgi:hypothetical protein
MSYSLAELRSMPPDRLIREHDEQAKTTVMGVNYYLEEIARRDAEAQGARMEQMTSEMARLTAQIRWLTVLITVLTAISTYAVIASR